MPSYADCLNIVPTVVGLEPMLVIDRGRETVADGFKSGGWKRCWFCVSRLTIAAISRCVADLTDQEHPFRLLSKVSSCRLAHTSVDAVARGLVASAIRLTADIWIRFGVDIQLSFGQT